MTASLAMNGQGRIMRSRTAAIFTSSALALGLGASFLPTTASAVPCTLSADFYGIAAISGAGGAITILTSGNVVVTPIPATATTVGISACAIIGAPITMDINGDVISPNGNGIEALNENGPIKIALKSGDISAPNGAGLRIQTMGPGVLTIDTFAGADISASGSAYGVAAFSNGGDVTVSLAGDVKNGGVIAATSGAGDTNVNINGAVYSQLGEGVSASTQTGAVSVNLTTTAAVTSAAAAAIHLEAGGGDAALSSQGTVTGVGTGIIIGAVGAGGIKADIGGLVLGSDAVFTSTTAGINQVNITGTLLGLTGEALDARSNSGSVQVNVGATGALNAKDHAMAALNAGSATGQVTVVNAGSINGSLRAASGAAAVAVTNTHNINNIDGSALELSSAGPVTVTNAGLISGEGTTDTAAIKVSGGGPVTIVNAGAISTVNPNFKGVAIDVAGASSLTLTNNPGAGVTGRIQASGNVLFNNGGAWRANGSSRFGPNATASTNTLANTGVVLVGNIGPTAAKTNEATFVNLGHFQNGSATTTGVIAMVNGLAGDSLTIDGDFKGQKGHSVLALDAYLGGKGSIADTLNVNGATSGQTAIRINDTNPGKGAINNEGITLVTGVSGKNDFILDPTAPNYDAKQGGIPKGLYLYDLKIKQGEAELTSHVNVKGQQLPSLLTALQDIFFGSGLSGLLPDNVFGFDETSPRLWMNSENWFPETVNPYRKDTPLLAGPGLQAGFDTALVAERAVTRVSDQTGETFSMNAGYRQNTSSIMSGFDLVRGRRDDSAWALGIAGGYIRSDQAFFTGQVLAQYDGARVGLYGRLARGAWRFDGEVRSDILALRYLASGPEGAGDGRASSLGFQASARYQAVLSPHWTLEPSAAVSLSSTRLSGLTLYGAPLAFSGGDSVRAALGVKLQGRWTVGDWRARAEFTGQVWNEFAGVNTAILAPDDPELAISDRLGGAWADIGAKLNLTSPDNRAAAYLATGVRVSERYQAANVAAGVTWRW